METLQMFFKALQQYLTQVRQVLVAFTEKLRNWITHK
jgi:hypothetical protein